MTEPPDLIDRPTLWSLSGASWIQMESQTGLSMRELRAVVNGLGFVRAPGGERWMRGPCVGCGKRFDAEELDEDFRCSDCHVPRESTAPAWLEEEREASRRRMEERDRGERPPLDRPYT